MDDEPQMGGEEQLKERVENLGFAGFRKKPVQSGELLEEVRAVAPHVTRHDEIRIAVAEKTADTSIDLDPLR